MFSILWTLTLSLYLSLYLSLSVYLSLSLYFSHDKNVIFDILAPSAFRKYSTCLVFSELWLCLCLCICLCICLCHCIFRCLCRLRMNSRAVLFPTMYNMFDWNAGTMFYWYIEISGLTTGLTTGEGEEEEEGGKSHSKVGTLRVRQKCLPKKILKQNF